ncbi:MAG: hypothetical protein Q4E27_02610 [Bacteroidales bacterium]|nr:hypothetical protein [Bacteroidales bacterium]
MKRLTTLSLIAVAVAAMIAVPVDAQTRGGSNSRGGSGGGNSRSSGGSRPSSSMSAPSTQMRSSGSAGNTKGLGSATPRSSQPSMSSQNRSATQTRPSTGSSGQVSRSGSNTRSSGSATQARPTNPSSGSVSRQTAPTRSSGTTVRQQRLPATGSTGSTSSVSGTQTRPSAGQPVRGGSNTRSSNTTSGTVARSRQGNQPAGSINRNQPQAGMSADRSAPGTVRSRTNAPRNYSGSSAPREVRMRPGPGRNIERIPPRHRDPMPFNRAVRFWDGGHHYFGYRVSYLPARYVREVYWGVPYYVLDGIYYRHYAGHYYICRPPFGVYFDPVLDNLAYSVCRFAYYYDVYNTYRTINENAQTMAYENANKLGLVQGYADANVEYYYEDGVFFTKDKSGKYVTIVPPAGALVQELPDDYETITLSDGKEYYKVDDTVYQMTIIDGSPYFEVLGQLTGELAEKYNQYNTL